jgi:hypothetical protein
VENQGTMVVIADTIHKFFSLIDSIVELYLGKIIKPFLSYHEIFYAAMNKTLRGLLDANKSKIADWFTANFITYVRTVFVIPTLLLLAWGHTLLPSFIVILVDFGDFLDGVVARFWVDIKKDIKLDIKKVGEEAEAPATSKDKDKVSSPPSPTNSDDESFGTYRYDEERSLSRQLLSTTYQVSFSVKDCSYMTPISKIVSSPNRVFDRNRNHRIPSDAYILASASFEPYIRWLCGCCL